MRAKAKAEGRSLRYDGRWRDRDPTEAPPGVAPVIRLKAPLTGQTVIRDRVQGDVVIDNEQLDDMVLLRADGTPIYMLSVVVDDHDMGVTHVIRGDDHLNNAARQMMLIEAMGWPVPVFAHIPLIHGPDGAKLSKRHGALGRRGLSRHGLPAGGAAQLPAAPRLEPWRRRDHLDRAGDRVVRPRRGRPLARRASTSRSSRTSTATTSARPATTDWSRWSCRASRRSSAVPSMRRAATVSRAAWTA